MQDTVMKEETQQPEGCVNVKMKMIGLMSKITDEVGFSRQDHHLHLCPQMKQAW